MTEAGIKKEIGEVLKELKLSGVGFAVEHPSDESHGDFSTNVALVLAKKAKQNPRELAEKVARKLEEKANSWVEKIEVAGPGFMNISIKNDHLIKEVS